MLSKKYIVIIVCVVMTAFFYKSHVKPLLAFIAQKTPISSEIIGPPKGCINAEKCATKSYLYSSESSPYPVENFPFLHTPGGINRDIAVTAKGFSTKLEKENNAWVYEIPNCRIYGQDGLIITQNDLLVENNAHQCGQENPQSHSIFNKLNFPSAVSSEETIAVIAVRYANCYYHWMYDVLPRLFMMKDLGIHYDKLYVGKLEYPFQFETLEYFQIKKENLIEANSKTHLKVKKVILPCPGNRNELDSKKWMNTFLRKTFLKTSVDSQEKPKRIYIARSQSARRHIINQQEVMTFLKPYGFESVYLEKLNFNQQVDLFSHAEVIIGYHGSGFTNLVFCDPHTKVLELLHPDYCTDLYWKLSQQLSLDHFVGEVIPEKEKDPECNGFINIKMLEQFLLTLKN